MSDFNTIFKNWDQKGGFSSSSLAWQRARREALLKSEEKGFPSKRSEDWKYTSVKPIQDATFHLPEKKDRASSFNTILNSHLIEGCDHLIFVNGFAQPFTPSTPDTWELTPSQSPQELQNSPRSHFQEDSDFFSELNCAFTAEPQKLTLNSMPSRPLQILYFQDLGEGPSLMVHPRLHLFVAEAAAAHILETFHGSSQSRYFFNGLTNVTMAKNSRLSWISLQDQSLSAFHMQKTHFYLKQSAELFHFSAHSGSSLSRQELKILLAEEHSSAQALAANILKGEQHHDDHTRIEHLVGETHSEQIYKNLLDDASRGVFDGRITITLQAQKSVSQQLNKNLLLSSKAEVDAKPQLKIHADDVTATHGSTVGQINPEELFYLLSRCIDKTTAQSMLAMGFITDLVERVEDPKVQQRTLDFLERGLQRNLARTVKNLQG